jgi:hypothetical protein
MLWAGAAVVIIGRIIFLLLLSSYYSHPRGTAWIPVLQLRAAFGGGAAVICESSGRKALPTPRRGAKVIENSHERPVPGFASGCDPKPRTDLPLGDFALPSSSHREKAPSGHRGVGASAAFGGRPRLSDAEKWSRKDVFACPTREARSHSPSTTIDAERAFGHAPSARVVLDRHAMKTWTGIA